MPFTLSCQDAAAWSDADPAKAVALAVYGESRIRGAARYLDGNQHDYSELSDEAIRLVFGEIADAPDSIGVFMDVSARTVDGIYVYSVPRLAADLEHRFPEFLSRYQGHDRIVDALDAGHIPVPAVEYPLARLVGNVVNAAMSPVAGVPALRILW